MKDKRLTFVVNDFDTFATTPCESVAYASNRYRIIVNNMTAQVNWLYLHQSTPLEYNLKFINSIGKGWTKSLTANSCDKVLDKAQLKHPKLTRDQVEYTII